MPANATIIGRVAVKVLPDTTDFRRDTNRKLDQIERGLEVNVKAKLDENSLKRELIEGVRRINAEIRGKDAYKVKLSTVLDTATTRLREQLNKAVREYERLSKTNRVKLKSELVGGKLDLELDKDNLKHVKDQIDRWRKNNSPVKLEVKLDWSTTSGIITEARIAKLTRPREVKLFPKVDNKALAIAATTLAALSGARVLHSMFEDFGNWLKNLDKSVPKISALTLGIMGLAGWGLTAAANLAALSASLASIAPAALALPGILGGMAVGATVTVVAFKDMSKVVPEVKQAWGSIKKTISENFWDKAAKPIRNMVDGLLPMFTAGFAQASTQIGGFFGSFASNLRTSFQGPVKQMFADLSKSVTIATGGTKSFANIITILGQAGASYLPRLAKWFVDISDRFSAFLTKAKGNGDLQRWIDTAITALTQLGTALKNLGGFLAGIGKAALDGGGSSLKMFSDTLERMNKLVNSADFQKRLSGLFSAAFQMMSNLSAAIGPSLNNLMKTLTSVFTDLLPVVGTTLGTLVGAISDTLSDPAMVAGFTQMFAGITEGIQVLAPAIKQLAPIFGSIFSLIGEFARDLGPLLAATLGAIAPIFQELVPAIMPLIRVLTGALADIIVALAPSIKTLAKAFASLIGPLAKALTPVLDALAPILGEVASIIAKAAAQILPLFAKALSQILPALAPLLKALGQLLISVLVPLMPAIMQIVKTALPPLTQAFVQLVPALLPFINVLSQLIAQLMPVLVPALTFLARLITGTVVQSITGMIQAFTGALNIISGVLAFFRDVFQGNWSKLWTDVKKIFSGIVGLFGGILRSAFAAVISALGSAFNSITRAFSNLGGVLKTMWGNVWNWIKNFASTSIANIVNWIGGLPGKISSFAGHMLTAGKTLIGALFQGLQNAAGAVGNLAADVGRAIVNRIVDGLNALIPHSIGIHIPIPMAPDVNIRVPLFPNIPHMADGGTVLPRAGGTLALLAEAGKAETVVDTGKMNRLIDQSLRNGAGSDDAAQKVLNYYAAPGSSISSEEDLFAASQRARFAW